MNTFKFKDLMVPVLPKDLKTDAKLKDPLNRTVCWKQTVVGPGPITCKGTTLPRDPLTKLTIRVDPAEHLKDLAGLREELREKVAVQKVAKKKG